MGIYKNILKKYRAGLLASPLLVWAAVACETMQPWFMSKIVDEGIALKDLSVITHVGLLMVGTALVGLLVSVVNIYLSSRISIGFGTDLREKLFNKIQSLSFPDIDSFSPASLITRLTNDVTRIQQVVLMGLRIMLRAPMLLLMSLFFIITINGRLSLILAASIPLLAISIYFIMVKGIPFFLKVQERIDGLNEVVRETMINIRVVKSFVREDHEARKFARSSDELREMTINAANIIVSIWPVMQLIMNFSLLAILWQGGAKVMVGELKIGELISFVNYLMQILFSLMMMSMIFMNTARASASSGRIKEVMETESSLSDPLLWSKPTFGCEKGGEVEFRNVSFRYPGGENDVLRNINFHVNPGETVAVVGSTGSAKSSMLQLIPRLYDATQGEVLVGGKAVGDYRLDDLHRIVGIVLQKNELFTGTILENIRWGNLQAREAEVEAAARAAEAHEFITTFTEGYNTLLGRGGINVSGGQKQRICIARALLRRPKILILDDSTSAVDSETEIRIRENLLRELSNTTIFIITQRVHTMQSADRVIVLDDGEIQAMGRPNELLRDSEIYREIYYSQQNNLEENGAQ